MRIEKDFEEFVELLNRHKVRYLIVRASACGFYTRPRSTGDIDFLIEPTRMNARRIRKALSDFGFGGLDIKEEDFLNPDIVIQLGVEPNRIDLLTAVSNLTFREAYRSKVQGRFGKQLAWFLSLDHLIESKRNTGRKQDEADVEALEALRRKTPKR